MIDFFDLIHLNAIDRALTSGGKLVGAGIDLDKFVIRCPSQSHRSLPRKTGLAGRDGNYQHSVGTCGCSAAICTSGAPARARRLAITNVMSSSLRLRTAGDTS